MKKLFLVAFLLFTVSSFSQDVIYEQEYGFIGVRAGTLYVDTIDYDEEVSFGFTFGYRFNNAIAVELSYDDNFNGIFGTGWSTDAYQASLLLYFPVSKQVQPYLVGGVGVYTSSYNYWATNGYDTTIISEVDYTDGGFHAGGGLELFLNDAVSIAIDGRYLFVEDEPDNQTKNDGFLTTVGLKVRF